MASTRWANGVGQVSSRSISSVNVLVASRFDTTTGAVIVSPSDSSTPPTRPSATRIRATRACLRSSPPLRSNRSRTWSDMAPMPPRTFDMAASSPGDASANAMHIALPGVYGPPEGRVHRQERQQPPHLGVANRVGEVAVDDIHDRAEHGRADGLALGLVGGAGVHLVERLRRRAHLEAARGPGPGPEPSS